VCRSAGIDPASEPIPIAPAAHYHMGGVLTDANGRTTVPGLWACGEVAATGAHGANRLASNSLLEAVVFGARVASDIEAEVPLAVPLQLDAMPSHGYAPQAAEPDTLAIQTLRRTMTAKVGVIRDAGSLISALCTIASLGGGNSDRRLANMLITAQLITTAALARKESRGAQFRSDYPKPDPDLARRSVLTLAEAEAEAAEAVASRGRQERSPARLHA
jgi:L-aspartate oxidase